METTDQVAEETRRVIRVLQEGARRVNQIRDLILEHNCELSFEAEALEAAARKLMEGWDLVEFKDVILEHDKLASDGLEAAVHRRDGEALEAAARRLAEQSGPGGLSNFVPAKLLAEEVRAQCASGALQGCTGGTA